MKATIIAASALMATAAGAQAETWDLPTAYPASNYHVENLTEFASCVAERSGGALEIEIHPNGALFAGNDIKRAVQTGQAPIGERLLSAHENENKLFGVDAIPFLVTSFDESDRLWEVARDKLAAALDEQNLVHLYSVPWPPQGLFTKKPINSAADLEGLKFRAYNAATSRIAELAGMVPVQIEQAELAQALATGVAEAFITSGATGVDSKVWEQVDHFYDAQAWIPRNSVLVNKDAWSGLDEGTRTALTDCGSEARERGTERAKVLTSEYLRTMADNGMTVAPPGDALKADLEGFGQTMTDEWIAAAGEDGQAIIDAYRKQ
ncbi:TRAP transporter substrate-binding protein [uncultured Paracoccus sp.]|uniref:TRAP transporter substrate-binding protein n=1 Tax=uncultured Paracoccus sp. TaxID=189685 RepID=UPI003458BCAE